VLLRKKPSNCGSKKPTDISKKLKFRINIGNITKTFKTNKDLSDFEHVKESPVKKTGKPQ
jgi:hypothetical protein